MTLIALTREISDSIVRCELTHLARDPIDITRARAQHASYERALEGLGCEVRRLPAGNDMPDSVFIEDAAIVFDEIGILTWPGAESRRLEIAAVSEALQPYRRLVQIEDPGTLDGGDVLVAGRSVFVGLTSRSNPQALAQMRRALEPSGYTVSAASVRGCLHLKSAITAVTDTALLVNRRWVYDHEFAGFDLIDVDAEEPMGANIVRVNGGLLYASAFPKTRERLEQRGFTVTAVDAGELAKAEGAVTCCSLIFQR